MVIEPEINYDLTNLFTHITQCVLPKKFFNVSYGFKQYDYELSEYEKELKRFNKHLKSNCGSGKSKGDIKRRGKGNSLPAYFDNQEQFVPITKQVTLKEFVPISYALYKEIQINSKHSNCNNFGIIGFDIDKPYCEIKDKLASLIYDKKLPEPSYIIIRQDNQHPHVVYLLDKRYSHSFKTNRTYLSKVQNHFTELLEADKGYVNCWFHNPFYEYSFENKKYIHSNSHGYYLAQSPNVNILDDVQQFHSYDDNQDYEINYQDNIEPISQVQALPFEFQVYNLKQLNDYVNSHYLSLSQKDIDEQIAKLYVDGKPAKSHKEMVEEHEKIYKMFPTGPDYRNNTLFYNAMYMAGQKKIVTKEGLLQYIQQSYKWYEINYPHLEEMPNVELKSIADSVWQYYLDDTIYIKKMRAWDGSDCVSFQDKQRERANKSVEVRRKQKDKALKKLENIILGIDFSNPLDNLYVDLGHFKHEMAQQFNCSFKTIERYLNEIKEIGQKFLFHSDRKNITLQDIQTILKKQFVDTVATPFEQMRHYIKNNATKAELHKVQQRSQPQPQVQTEVRLPNINTNLSEINQAATPSCTSIQTTGVGSVKSNLQSIKQRLLKRCHSFVQFKMSINNQNNKLVSLPLRI